MAEDTWRFLTLSGLQQTIWEYKCAGTYVHREVVQTDATKILETMDVVEKGGKERLHIKWNEFGGNFKKKD